ncbi:hypothetical protein D3C72_2126960 [compost metagenome]
MPPIKTLPEVAFSSPAMMRKVVDLPQPDGPSSTQKLPGAIFRSTECKAVVLPQDLATCVNSMDDIAPVYEGTMTICLQTFPHIRAISKRQRSHGAG